MASRISHLTDLALKGQRVFLRLDLNVPLEQSSPGQWRITDDTRIREALPTIRYCLDQGAKRVILCSHLGRPEGKRRSEFSLEPVAKHLVELLGEDVLLSEEAVGDGVQQMVAQNREQRLILLENIRFYPEEEANDRDFSRKLAELADVYVSDAFGTAHRKHASTYGAAQVASVCAAGLLIERELRFLTRLIESPAHPYVLVVGGSKVTDKLKAIEHLLNFVDRLVVGGAMAYAFLAAQGKSIGKSKCEKDGIPAAEAILKKAQDKRVEILLPQDHLVVFAESDPEWTQPQTLTEIPPGATALDIGPATRSRYVESIGSAATIFWNGPMGFFEKPLFAEGTKAIATAIADSKAIKVAGGGDTLAAIALCQLGDRFDLLSTGGGASLKFLEGRGLPGIEVLRSK
jgi:phosphoglycerate kinase